jgi:hypothetical protein
VGCEEGEFFWGGGAGGVGEEEGEVCAVDVGLCEGDGCAFEGVWGLALAWGVEEADDESGEVGFDLDVVACGAWEVGCEAGVGFGEGVGEGRFADVGQADYRDGGGAEEVV